MHSICPLYFDSLFITSEAVTRDKVVHALPSRWRLKVLSPVSRGPRASPAQRGGCAARARGAPLTHPKGCPADRPSTVDRYEILI